jgi:hypothetical protein
MPALPAASSSRRVALQAPPLPCLLPHLGAGHDAQDRVNLREYSELSCVVAVTLIWDRSSCRHAADERCSGRRGCRVEAGAAALWNEASRRWWRELNRICKQRADRAIRQLGAVTKGGVLMYEWELQKRGVWHLHVVLGMETGIERAWAYAYVKALEEVGPAKGFGFIDRKPLHAPRPAEQSARISASTWLNGATTGHLN